MCKLIHVPVLQNVVTSLLEKEKLFLGVPVCGYYLLVSPFCTYG